MPSEYINKEVLAPCGQSEGSPNKTTVETVISEKSIHYSTVIVSDKTGVAHEFQLMQVSH